MAIRANLNFKGIPLTNAYIRLNLIQGGKRQGWSGHFGVYASAEAAQGAMADALFTFGASATYYAEDQGHTPEEAAAIGTHTPVDPFAALYDQAKAYLAADPALAVSNVTDV